MAKSVVCSTTNCTLHIHLSQKEYEYATNNKIKYYCINCIIERMVRCKVCHEPILVERLEAIPNAQTCVKHSDEKTKDHQPGVVNSLGLHEKYFPEGR